MELTEIIIQIATKYPWIIVVLSVMGATRIVFNGLFSMAQAYVDSTVDVADNEVLIKVEQSKWFKTVSYILDFAFSVKIPVKKVSVEVVK